jgi:hypothetical protein
VEDGIQADPFFNGPVGFNFESLQQFGLVVIMKGVNNFVCKPDKAVNIEDGLAKVMMQETDGTTK